MALIIEDGSLPAGADSFVTVAEVRAFADALAFTGLPVDDADLEPHCRKSANYVRSIEYKFQGIRISVDQALTWPREPVYIYGFEFPSDEIPQELKDGCCQLAIDSANGTALEQNTSGRTTIKERVEGAVDITYADGSASDGTTNFNVADSYFQPLYQEQFKTGGGNYITRV